MKLATAMMLLLFALQPGCGSAADDGATGPDMTVPAGIGDPCVTNYDCRSAAFVCAFPIADGCSAKGHCALVPTPTCASFIPLCGCDGSEVWSGACFYQPGYAGGPTTGKQLCGDGGI